MKLRTILISILLVLAFGISAEAADQIYSQEADGVKKKARPKPDPNFKGVNIGDSGVKKALVPPDKVPSSMLKVETTKAQHVKNLVEQEAPPELKALEEKRLKRKEHFKAQLEKSEKRKALRVDKSGNVDDELK